MNKKWVAAVLALCMVVCMGTTALAADDGAAPDVPAGEVGRKSSAGAATVVGDDFDVTGDDDETAADAEDLNDADINLWSRVTGTSNGDIVYKIDVEWGTMAFIFEWNERVWNPTTHSYTGAPTGTAGEWKILGADGTVSRLGYGNEEIAITSHSNHAIKVTHQFTMNEGAFNADPDDPDKVVFNFFWNNPFWAALQLENTATVPCPGFKYYDNVITSKPKSNSITLETAESYRYGEGDRLRAAGERVVFYTLFPSGTPDIDKQMDTFIKVGTITLTFEPDLAEQSQYYELSGVVVQPQNP